MTEQKVLCSLDSIMASLLSRVDSKPGLVIVTSPNRSGKAFLSGFHPGDWSIRDQHRRAILHRCGQCVWKNKRTRVNKLAEADLALSPACTVHPLPLAGALRYLKCLVEELIPLGDHVFVFGREPLDRVQADAFNDVWEPITGAGLLCLQHDRFGRYIDIKENN